MMNRRIGGRLPGIQGREFCVLQFQFVQFTPGRRRYFVCRFHVVAPADTATGGVAQFV